MEVKCRNNFLDGIDFILYTIPRIRLYQILLILFMIEIFFFLRPSLFKPERALLVSVFTYLVMVTPLVLGLFLLLFIANVIAILFNRRFFYEKTVILSDECVKTIVPGERSEMDWDRFKKIRLTKRLILFYTNDRCALFVPKRSFGTQEAVGDFYQYAVSKIETSQAIQSA